MAYACVFPLHMMRTACGLSARGFAGSRYQTRRPCVINAPVAVNVWCGMHPLSRIVTCHGEKMFTAGGHCYINDRGETVIPG